MQVNEWEISKNLDPASPQNWDLKGLHQADRNIQINYNLGMESIVTCRKTVVSKCGKKVVQDSKPKLEYPKMICKWVEAGKLVTITPKEMVTLTWVLMVTTGAQTLMWRLFNKAFWSESTFPVDHTICHCVLCPFNDANLEHKFFACIIVSQFWTEVANILNFSVHFQQQPPELTHTEWKISHVNNFKNCFCFIFYNFN
ncbi:hypothetical protein DSO57_1026777 [Entomophthora muscae]|uniref:Uncharacterized protein n=1 Tax=Entomophthora muscae TaxID=34485 RepID=A0ACC2SET3_9FUNG|nr:hypothetical protein DSO57_1026777 [Entomophthora muscae]